MMIRNGGQPNYSDLDTLKALVPSIFELTPSARVSERYAAIPTITVLEALRSEGWMITKAQQSKSKLDTTAKHLIRLRHQNTKPILDGVFPEIVLVNSHDGSSSYQLRAGVYRLVCLNGMVVGSDQFCERVRHFGKNVPELVAASANKILAELPIIGEKIIELHETPATRMGNRVFAMAAVDARMNDPMPVEAQQAEVERVEHTGTYRGVDIRYLTAPRRVEDQPMTLWNTFNILQEKLINGGVRGGASRRRMVGIKSVERNVALNSDLWRIAENVAQMTRDGQLS